MTFAFCALGSLKIYAQGCSDAGFCTLDGFKPHSPDRSADVKNQVKAGAFFGKADHSILVSGGYLEFNRQVSEKFSLDAKWTAIAQSGNGISVFGPSDLFVNANYKAANRIQLTLGAKIPLANGNKTRNNQPLPMDYQASLGTFDLVLGIGYAWKGVQLVAALQQPLTQNKNQFVASSYPSDSKLAKFQTTKNFERRGDVLLRVSYPFILTRRLKLTPSILPIYHLSNDRYTDEFNAKREITGSRGLTLNGNAYLDYEINGKNLIQINMGMPFLARESRPDGLTRSFIVNLEYRLKF